MKVEIEIYRGWSISFDTDKETFYCHSEQYDRDNNKKSFASVKKWIDDFIKDNEFFKPVWVEAKSASYRPLKKVKLIGLRKDGRFVYEDEKGEKQQLSSYEEKDYIIHNKDNDKYNENALDIDKKMEALRLEKQHILSKITGIELTEYKKQIQGK